MTSPTTPSPPSASPVGIPVAAGADAVLARSTPATPVEAAVADAGHADTIADTVPQFRWALAPDDRRLVLAAAAAVWLHLLPVAALVGGLSVIGIDPPTAEMGLVGNENGSRDGVGVDLIDGADYNQMADAAAMTPPPQQQRAPDKSPPDKSQPEKPAPDAPSPDKPSPDKQAPDQANADKPAPDKPDADRKNADKPRPEETAEDPPDEHPADLPPAPIAVASVRPTKPPPPPPPPAPVKPQPKSDKLTQADIAAIFEATKPANMLKVAPGLGKSSEFQRTVYRKLQAAIPNRREYRGVVVVGVVLSEGGDLVRAEVLKTTASPELTKLVLDRVRSVHYAIPGVTVPPKEREFPVICDFGTGS